MKLRATSEKKKKNMVSFDWNPIWFGKQKQSNTRCQAAY